jgi:hypothetical protein
MPAIRVELPLHLCRLANITGHETLLSITAPATIAAVLDALEASYPQLRGTIRDHTTLARRPFLRYFVCEEDWSHQSPNIALPEPITSGAEPLLIIGAIAGG